MPLHSVTIINEYYFNQMDCFCFLFPRIRHYFIWLIPWSSSYRVVPTIVLRFMASDYSRKIVDGGAKTVTPNRIGRPTAENISTVISARVPVYTAPSVVIYCVFLFYPSVFFSSSRCRSLVPIISSVYTLARVTITYIIHVYNKTVIIFTCKCARVCVYESACAYTLRVIYYLFHTMTANV